MIYINVIFLILLSFAIGYFVGKGKIEIVRKAELTEEQKHQIEENIKRQQEVIDQYNTLVKEYTTI